MLYVYFAVYLWDLCWNSYECLCLFSSLFFANFPQWLDKPIKHSVFFQPLIKKTCSAEFLWNIEIYIYSFPPFYFFLLCFFFFCSQLSWVCQDNTFYWVVCLVLTSTDVMENGWKEPVECQILNSCSTMVWRSHLYQRDRERGRCRNSWGEKLSEHYLMLLWL